MILHHRFIETARRYSSKMSVIDRTGHRRLTYRRILIGSLILARRIQMMPDCYIGVMVPNSAASFLAVLGTVVAGKIPVMINYSTGAVQNYSHAKETCGFQTLLTSRALLRKLRLPQARGMICLEDLWAGVRRMEKAAAVFRSAMPLPLLIRSVWNSDQDDTAVILFTSGSEKEPKAVPLTHRNIAANLRDLIQVFELTDKDSIFSILPLFHVFGHTIHFWLPLTMGMTAVTYANPLDYRRIPAIIREEKPTILTATPAFLGGYLREAGPGDFTSLRLIVAGADRVPDWIRDAYLKEHGKELLEGYGTTETSPVISVNTPRANRPGSIGRPLPSVKVRIADIETGAPLPRGNEGKILVKGDLVMKGYLRDVVETSLRIRDGWYDTGDMGVMDSEGFLWHKGRLRRFVKIGGEMVSLVRVESVLESLLPEGVDGAVVEVPDPRKGAKLVVAVTGEVDQKELVRRLAGKLPPIAVPREFVRFDELPRMGSGKSDFRKITAMVGKRLLDAHRLPPRE
jgi:acyl-[acyl-carrier-protein]-phospholipid O-acyltransferase/long-chain-fatty-acid--[acyl-carrier-protein] ligase